MAKRFLASPITRWFKLYYLKKEVMDQNDFFFFQVDKHKSFLQVAFVAFDGSDEACQKYPK